MRGYLSQIAGQSGLRFSSGSAGTRRGARGPRAGLQPEPLDREETLMVSPGGELKSSEVWAEKGGRSFEAPVSKNVFLKSDQKKTTFKSNPKQVVAPSAQEQEASPVGVETVFVGLEPESYHKKQALASGEDPVSMTTESVTAEAKQSILANPQEITGQPERRAVAQDKAAFAETREADTKPVKQFFTKTAEVIGGQVTEPLDMQTILLQEILEWVDAGTVSEAAEGMAADDTAVDPVAVSPKSINTKASAQTTKSEVPGVRIIGETLQQAPHQQMASRIDEQNYDLSIGTISVVIEGDERPPQSATPPRVDKQKSGYDEGHRRSRLGRNYL